MKKFFILFSILSVSAFAQETHPFMYGDREPTPSESVSYYEDKAKSLENQQEKEVQEVSTSEIQKSDSYKYFSVSIGGSSLDQETEFDPYYNDSLGENIAKENWTMKNDIGLSLDFAVGKQVSENWRWEISGFFSHSNVTSAVGYAESTTGTQYHANFLTPDITTDYYAVLGSAYFYLPIEGKIKPYLGGGFGAGVLNLEWNDAPENDEVTELGLIWKLSAGVDIYSDSSNSVFSVEYNYQQADLDYSDGKSDVSLSTILMKVRWPF